MSNSKQEKVFRKEGRKPSKGDENFFGFCAVAFFSSLIGFVITSAIIIIRDYPLQYELTTFTSKLFHLCCILTPISFFLLFLSFCVLDSTGYTLILNESTLTYTCNTNTTTLTLPCSSIKREKGSIVLANGSTKVFLFYDEKEEADLLEFLKDVIN